MSIIRVCSSVVKGAYNRTSELGGSLISAASKAKKFFGSTVGRALTGVATSTGAEYAGMQIGGVFPQAAIGLHVGEAVANKFAPGRETHEDDEGRIVVSSSRSRKWKVIFAGAALTAAGLLTLAMSRMASSSEDSEQSMFAGQMLLSTAGSIIGGMQALRATGNSIPENYAQRSAQYFAAAGAVNFVRHLMPTPARFAFLPRMVGSTAALVAGTTAYHAQGIVSHLQNPDRLMGCSYDKAMKMVITAVWPSTHDFAQNMSAYVSLFSPIDGIARSAITFGVERSIENRSAANVLARCLNDYAGVIRSSPTILNALEEFRAADGSADTRKALIKAIQGGLADKFSVIESGQYALGLAMQSKLEGLVNYIIHEIPNWETALIGFPLTDQSDDFSNELRRIHLTLFLTYAVQKFPSFGMRSDLRKSEMRIFYSNAARLMCGAYADVIPERLQQAAIEVVDAVLPHAIRDAKPRSFMQKLVDLVKRSVASIWRTISILFSLFPSKCRVDDAVDDESKPRGRLIPVRINDLVALGA